MIWRIFRSLLFLLPAETAHDFSAWFLKRLGALFYRPRPLGVAQAPKGREIFGQRLTSPLGLAAGFDKDGDLIQGISMLGFGFVELGTVTPEPQPGNPTPRLFRLPRSQGLINRMGFNSQGAEAMCERLQQLCRRGTVPMPIGINIGKNRDTTLEHAQKDYMRALEMLYGVADFFVVNLSSPNTPGLRELQGAHFLGPLVRKIKQTRDECDRVQGGRKRELLLKISPDMEEADRKLAVEIAMEAGFEGIVATNTTIRRDLPGIDFRDQSASEQGGLSGAPLHDLAVEHVTKIRSQLGTGPLLISVGGLKDEADVEARLAAGADLVEVYTQFIYAGPFFPRRVARHFSDKWS